MARIIQIYVQALAQLLEKKKTDFADLSRFNHYKKQQIQAQRNQLLANQLNCAIDDLAFAKHEHGKPFLTSHSLHFNHS